jgi:MFS transporter, DHA1 family, tetracycline resistance protein
MGLIGAAFGLGFIFGPAIGGLLAPVAPELPGLAAAGLCAANALLAVFLLPESLSDDDRAPQRHRRVGRALSTRMDELRVVLRHTGFLQVLLLSFLFTTAFAAMHPTFPLFASRRFGLDERDVGWLFAFMGTVSAVMQGGLVRFLAPRLGEVGLIRMSAFPFVIGLLLIASAPTVAVLLLGLALLAVGFGGTLPSLVSLMSRAAPAELQGGSLGVGQSVGALARIVGPLLAGVLWDLAGIAWPYLAAAAIGALAGLWGLKLRQPG